MDSSAPTIAVIDGYLTGGLLAPLFRAHNMPVVHVHSAATSYEYGLATYRAGDYVASIEHSGDVEETARRLAVLGVRHVVSGSETGSDVGDELAQELQLDTANSPGFSHARRDKRTMHRLLYESGVPVPWQRHLGADGQVVWETPGPEPSKVVVKPSSSAGTDSVHICQHGGERARAITSIMTSHNIYGCANDGIIVQEFLDGPEYMINTVSVDGAHSCIEIWRSEKKLVDKSPVYDMQMLEDPESESMIGVIEYAFEILTTLGVKWGVAHTEVIVTTSGPLLLETATRVPGGNNQALALAAMGTSVLDEMLLVYAAPEEVVARGRTRKLRRAAMGVSLIMPYDGEIVLPIDSAELRRLPSYFGCRINGAVGDRVCRTVDVFSKPGTAYLCHERRAQVDRDYHEVRRWESREFARAVRVSQYDRDSS